MKKSLTLFLVLCVVAFFNYFCNLKSNSDANKSEYLNHNDTVKYVGMQQCRSCHEDKYKTFIETGMGKSFDIASKSKSSADFSTHQIVYDKFRDFYYAPILKNDSLYVFEFRLFGKDTIYKRFEKVDFIIGSGQHTNSHFTNINGYLFQLPLTWYAQKKRWDLPPGYENNHNVRFNRSIEFECMSCHNAMPTVADFTSNKFMQVQIGIDCERCHGPGELHVKEKLAGYKVDTANEIDYTIVNPRKLSWERQIDVCQRCHLQGNAVLKDGKSFNDFRPGMKLSDYWEVYMPKQKDSEDEFIMASHAQRLQMSKCFIESNKKIKSKDKKFETLNLTCVTCHNPHISVKLTGKQVFNNACIKCHNTADVKTCNEKSVMEKYTKSSSIDFQKNANCVSCHMPSSGTIDIPHVTVHDHWIRKNSNKHKMDNAKEFIALYCINNSNINEISKAKAYLSYYEKFEQKNELLDSADLFLTLNEKNGSLNFDTRIHLAFLKNKFENIIEFVKNNNKTEINNAWTSYRIGQSFQYASKFIEAELYYKNAIRISPESYLFYDKLASVLIQQGRIEDAILQLNVSLQKNPKQESALTNLGYAFMLKSDTKNAKKYYEMALSLNPDYEQALLNMVGLFIYLNDTKSAKIYLLKVRKSNATNKEVKRLLELLND